MLFISTSEENPVPLYQQIVNQVRRQIIVGELGAGEPLPSIRQLAKDLTTSVITTKRAYQELERDGYIYTRPGKGSFVAQISSGKIEELKRLLVREHLNQAYQEAKQLGVDQRIVSEMLNEILKGDSIWTGRY